MVGQSYLFYRLILAGQLFADMFRIDHRQGAVKTVTLGDEVILTQRKQYGGWIGQPCGFNQQPMKRLDLTAQRLHEQLLQGAGQRALHRTADATGIEHHHLLVDLLYQLVIKPDATELVDQHSTVGQLRLLHPVVEQCGLAATEETGDQVDGNAGIGGRGHDGLRE